MILTEPKEEGVLLKSTRFCFATPTEDSEKLFYYIPWCGHFFCDSNYRYERSYYPYCLLVYVRAGELRFEYRGKKDCAQAGDVLLLDCREPHCYYGDEGLEFYYIHFDGVNSHELTQYILLEKGPLLRNAVNTRIYDLMAETIACYQNNVYENPVEVSLRVGRFLQALLLPQDEAPATDDPVLKTIRYIHQHIKEPLSVQTLAAIAHLSPFYYSRLFKKHTGFAPLNYIQNLRLNQAKDMLLSTDKTISEIGLELGYASGASFSNVFAEKVGCSPKNYRNLMNH